MAAYPQAIHQRAVLLGATLLTLVTRIFTFLTPHNLKPMGGLALYAGARCGIGPALALVVGVMAVSDLALYGLLGFTPFTPFVYAAFAIYVLLGRCLRGATTPHQVLLISVLASGQFFLLTNLGTWFIAHAGPGAYDRSWNGLLLCYAAGVPFFWATLLGDLFSSLAIFGAEVAVSQPQTQVAKG
jgi:hypothetical protein